MAKKKHVSTEFNEIKLFDPEEEHLDFPSICKFIRKTFSITQEQMAQKLNTTLSGYTYWEYGKRTPTSWQAFNLCRLYDEAKKLASKQGLLEEPLPENTSQDPQQNAA